LGQSLAHAEQPDLDWIRSIAELNKLTYAELARRNPSRVPSGVSSPIRMTDFGSPPRRHSDSSDEGSPAKPWMSPSQDEVDLSPDPKVRHPMALLTQKSRLPLRKKVPEKEKKNLQIEFVHSFQFAEPEPTQEDEQPHAVGEVAEEEEEEEEDTGDANLYFVDSPIATRAPPASLSASPQGTPSPELSVEVSTDSANQISTHLEMDDQDSLHSDSSGPGRAPEPEDDDASIERFLDQQNFPMLNLSDDLSKSGPIEFGIDIDSDEFNLNISQICAEEEDL
jgi:hypothetical protein